MVEERDGKALLEAQREFPGPRFATPVFAFVASGARHLLANLRDVDERRAWELMVAATDDWLTDEKCTWGDPRFDWSEAGARDLATAYVLDHAEF
jgi:hypothetical protein